MADVAGRAVQVRDVAGGVHFHGQDPRSHFAPVPRQLPGDVPGFVNRLGEMEVLSGHLRDEGSEDGPRAPIHLIAGTAGVGKTALALHWAHRVREHFPDGQLYVDLRGHGAGPSVEPGHVLQRFLRALDVARELDNPVREEFALLELGRIQVPLGDTESALDAFHEAASLHREIGDHVREAEAFEGVGEVYRAIDRPDQAAKFYRQAAKECRGYQEWWRLAVCLGRSASVIVEGGDVEAAGGQWREALSALDGFTDPRAERLREQIIARLDNATGPGWSQL